MLENFLYEENKNRRVNPLPAISGRAFFPPEKQGGLQ